MIELFLVKSTEMIEIPTESITWSGKRYNAARKIDVKILHRGGFGREVVNVEEGDTILFKWQGVELFRGIAFNGAQTKSGILSLTAYDMMQYLLLNRDVYVFTNSRADQIATRLMKDFEIPFEGFANTVHKIKTLVFDTEITLYDMILKGLIDTQKQTSRRHRIYSKQGKVRLERLDEPSSMWVLETGVNIEDYTYTTSISETATRVKLVAGEESKQITATVTDTAGKTKFGVLQHFEKVSGEINQAQLNDRANKTLASKKGIKRKLDISAIGIPDLVSGMPVRVIEKEIPIDKTYYVDSDVHLFKSNSHTMTLNLIENNDMPEVG